MNRYGAFLLAVASLVLVGCTKTTTEFGPETGPVEEATRLSEAYHECDVVSPRMMLADDNHTIEVSGGYDADYPDLICVLRKLKTPQRILAAMDPTTASPTGLDANMDSAGLSYEWSHYYPDVMYLTIRED